MTAEDEANGFDSDTSKQMLREISWLRQFLETRMNGYDKAIALLQANTDRMPTPEIVQGEVVALKELTASNIDALGRLIDAQFKGNQTALDAALKTQKEASDKIESNFSKQFDGINSVSAARSDAVQAQISDLKDNANKLEGRDRGAVQQRGENREGLGTIGLVVGMIVGLAGLVLAIIGNV